MLKSYRKLPVVINAMQWDGTAESASHIIDWILLNGGSASYVCSDVDRCANGQDCPHWIVIDTLEGSMFTDVNDYVICGVKGEFYPCKSEIFEMTYEEFTP